MLEGRGGREGEGVEVQQRMRAMEGGRGVAGMWEEEHGRGARGQ